ncbi:hypothetical protein HYW75_01580 [Candidatus Pacearchaeota archaeon]|nr:hypothetical protein [Candidatus Pacearchaeota archaeon]
MKKIIVGGIIALLILGIWLFAGNDAEDVTGNSVMDLSGQKITVYKTGTCGCCGLYVDYLKRKDLDVEVIDSGDINQVKNRFGVPAQLQSCHTTQIGDYFVEGHIPIEAISKLMAEKPDLVGIALPGMPSGAPGMPGGKQGKFIIYGITKGGAYETFVEI